jgi:AraC-like DNA-binding protein
MPHFTLRVSGLATYPPGATYGPRTLRDYEFVWILEGAVRWEIEGLVPIEAQPGSVLLARPGMRDRFEWDAARSTRHGFIHFDLSSNRIEGLDAPSAWPLIRTAERSDALVPVLEQVLAVAESRRREHGLVVQTGLAHALVGFVSGATATHDAPLQDLPEPVDRSLRYVQKRWREQDLRGPTLAELAHAAGVSEGHTIRLYRQAFGCGPAEVLRIARLERAAQMLVRTNLGVAEIAALHGFLDPFHFSRAVKQLFRKSPRALRAAVRAGEAMPVPKLVRARFITRWLFEPQP